MSHSYWINCIVDSLIFLAMFSLFASQFPRSHRNVAQSNRRVVFIPEQVTESIHKESTSLDFQKPRWVYM